MNKILRKLKRYNYKRRGTFILTFLVLIFLLALRNEIFAQKVFKTYNAIDKEITTLTTEPEVEAAKVETVKLVSVIDGDTIIVKHIDTGAEEKIRLLEVDTLESVHEDESKNNEYGERASEFTKEYLKNYTYLFLTYDIDRTDQYGRTLAYVWLKEDIDITNEEDIKNFCYNAILLENGMARVTVYAPNVQYEVLFTALKEDAKANNIGLWAEEGYRVIAGE